MRARRAVRIASASRVRRDWTRTARRIRSSRRSVPKRTTCASMSTRRRTARPSPICRRTSSRCSKTASRRRSTRSSTCWWPAAAGAAPRAEQPWPSRARCCENPRARVFVRVPRLLPRRRRRLACNMRDSPGRRARPFLGPDDLVAVMTPDMSARDLSFAREDDDDCAACSSSTGSGASAAAVLEPDPEDERYRACYPVPAPDKRIAEEMIERRREKRTLDALQDVVRYLRGAREERKAVLVDLRRMAAASGPTSALRATRRTTARRPGSRSGSIRGRVGSRPTTRRGCPDRPIRARMRSRSYGPRPDRQRPAVPRHHGRSEPRQRVVLPDRSARPRRLRRADHELGASGAPPPAAAERRPGAPDRAPRVAARAGGRHRRDGHRRDQRPRRRVQADRRRSVVVLPARLLLDRRIDGRFHSIRVG